MKGQMQERGNGCKFNGLKTHLMSHLVLVLKFYVLMCICYIKFFTKYFRLRNSFISEQVLFSFYVLNLPLQKSGIIMFSNACTVTSGMFVNADAKQ